MELAFNDFKAGTTTRTGIMVHYVILEVDQGCPIMVQEIECQGEGLAELEERIQRTYCEGHGEGGGENTRGEG